MTLSCHVSIMFCLEQLFSFPGRLDLDVFGEDGLLFESIGASARLDSGPAPGAGLSPKSVVS